MKFNDDEREAWSALSRTASLLLKLVPVPTREDVHEHDRIELVHKIHELQDWLIARAAIREGFE